VHYLAKPAFATGFLVFSGGSGRFTWFAAELAVPVLDVDLHVDDLDDIHVHHPVDIELVQIELHDEHDHRAVDHGDHIDQRLVYHQHKVGHDERSVQPSVCLPPKAAADRRGTVRPGSTRRAHARFRVQRRRRAHHQHPAVDDHHRSPGKRPGVCCPS
jgi:hypothetical protein